MFRWRWVTAGVFCLLLAAVCPAPARADDLPEGTLRAGIIGLDTSHVVAFTNALNNTRKELGVRVVAAYPGGSPDVESSHTRVEGYTAQLRDKFKVEIVGSIAELLPKVDVILLESVDGRPHLEQVRPVFAARKPVFIDKPVAGSLADAIKIFELARETGTPCFSSSSLRYDPKVIEAAGDSKIGKVLGCETFSPCSLEKHHPDLFWYGVHGVEMLYAVMGRGCKTVARTQTKDTELVTGVWANDRIGVFRGLRVGAGYGVLTFGAKGSAFSAAGKGGYEPLLVEICTFFKTKKAPVSPDETIELFAFMEAADESKRQGGCPVTIESVMAKARAAAAVHSESKNR